jgi:uncharacterized protein DUF6152
MLVSEIYKVGYASRRAHLYQTGKKWSQQEMGPGEAREETPWRHRWRIILVKLKLLSNAGMIMAGPLRKIWRETMRNRSSAIFLVAFGLLAVSFPLFAHHGNAAYDYEKTITIKGTVTEWIFANPHSLVKADVTDDKGNVQHWVLEGNAASLSDLGWHKTTLKPGDIFTFELMPSKNNAPIGRIRRILKPDGSVLADSHLPSTLNDVPPPKSAPKPTSDSNSDGSR